MTKSSKKTPTTPPKVELSGKLISFICSVAAIIVCILALIIKFFSRDDIDITWFVLLLTNISVLFANINLAKINKKK